MLPPDVKSIVVERDEGVQVSGCLEKGSYRFFFSVFFDSAYARVQLCIRSMATWPHCQKTQTEKEQTPPCPLVNEDLGHILGQTHPIDQRRVNGIFQCLILLGIHRVQNHRKAWSSARAQVIVRLSELLTCQRFELLGCFLHVVSPEEEQALSSDRLKKLLPLLNHMKAKCLACYQPLQHLSVDKRMVKSKAYDTIHERQAHKMGVQSVGCCGYEWLYH